MCCLHALWRLITPQKTCVKTLGSKPLPRKALYAVLVSLLQQAQPPTDPERVTYILVADKAC